jgi:hypothetical protein
MSEIYSLPFLIGVRTVPPLSPPPLNLIHREESLGPYTQDVSLFLFLFLFLIQLLPPSSTPLLFAMERVQALGKRGHKPTAHVVALTCVCARQFYALCALVVSATVVAAELLGLVKFEKLSCGHSKPGERDGKRGEHAYEMMSQRPESI